MIDTVSTKECCLNCGLPRVRVRARIRLQAENDYLRDSFRRLPFCSEECAYQTAFLQLHTVSTPTTITRYLGSKPITYAEFRSKVKLGVEPVAERGLMSRKPIAETRINTGVPEAENEKMGLPYTEVVSGRSERLGGRPRKWSSEAERKRAYRERAREKTAEVASATRINTDEKHVPGSVGATDDPEHQCEVLQCSNA